MNKYNEMGVLERLTFTSSQNAYTKGIAFDQKNISSLLQIFEYYFSMAIRLEEVIEWLFEEYLASELDAHNFKVTMPSANSTLLGKMYRYYACFRISVNNSHYFSKRDKLPLSCLKFFLNILSIKTFHHW
ncbi:hypothetical protein ACEU2D_20095 [Brevibacillus laterosporus]|uniref:hypothetical protein n=1 Tax=Brevibacillus laterosporus TaxID=1465 RepID=UPI0035A6374E